MSTAQFTPSGVRLRRHNLVHVDGGPTYLLLPGGPGIGSESLADLADLLTGDVWLVDLPGDGSNTNPPVSTSPYDKWPGVLIEAANAIPGAIVVGHSTGGMYLLSVPELQDRAKAIVLISSAPDASWQESLGRMCAQNPLPQVDIAGKVYAESPTVENLRNLAVTTAEWNFTPAGLSAGRDLLARMPYNAEAVDWSEKNFDHTYQAKWWPALPVLIVSGAADRIVDQSLWDDPRYHGENVTHVTIPAAAHFPWIEQPEAVRKAFNAFVR